jgi:hypothetical protein
MELRAVIEALRNLPYDMHVWISTDSAYVKRGITELRPNWMANNWRNATRAAIANLTLWQDLIAAVSRMRIVKWTWVKARNGYLLNECADMLATKGVNNETPLSNVQYLHPINEDIDFETYKFKECELPIPDSDWQGDVLPGVTYTQKNEKNKDIFLPSSTRLTLLRGHLRQLQLKCQQL